MFLSLVLTPVLSVNVAHASTLNWAESVYDFSQGLTSWGRPVAVSNSDPSNALGVNDELFVSLGFKGKLILEFPVKAGGSIALDIYERTGDRRGGTYPLEQANVYVSDDGEDWHHIGVATNEEGQDDGITSFDINGKCVKFVKIVDFTNPDLFPQQADAIDIDAVSIEYDQECIELPNIGDDKVTNRNSATVINVIEVNANTGGNFADGSYGGTGGDGGDIESGKGEIVDSSTRNGGDGGNSSVGGTVITGNAQAEVGVFNLVNTNRTIIDRSGGGGDIIIGNDNSAKLINEIGVEANTGNNFVDGSYGGSGGDGGDISLGDNGEHGHKHDRGIEDVNTGHGGDGGTSGAGGLVITGDASSRAFVVNIVNTTVTRIRR